MLSLDTPSLRLSNRLEKLEDDGDADEKGVRAREDVLVAEVDVVGAADLGFEVDVTAK